MLDEESLQISNVIAGYIAKKYLEKNKCAECEILLLAPEIIASNQSNQYLNELSRGGLLVPSTDFSHFSHFTQNHLLFLM